MIDIQGGPGSGRPGEAIIMPGVGGLSPEHPSYIPPAGAPTGPESPGWTPGSGEIYLGIGPTGPTPTGQLTPVPGLPGEAHMVMPAPAISGGTGPIEVLTAAVSGFVSGGWTGAALGAAEALHGTGGEAMPDTDIDLYGRAGLVNGVSVGGPGVPEPPPGMVAKAWKTKAFSKAAGEYWVYFFKLHDGRIMCWNAAKQSWKIWRPKKPIVLYRGKITLSKAVQVQKVLDKLWHTTARKTKQLKLA